MSPITLLPDLPGCSVEQVSQTEDTLVITAPATTSSACCPDCHQVSSHVHSTYIRSPKTLPSSGRPVLLQLQVRRFRCLNQTCRRKTFAESFPRLIAPYAQRTSSVQDLLRLIGEAMGGRAGARLSQQLAMQCSPSTILRFVCQAPLPSASAVRVVGVDEWAWRKGQRYGTLLVEQALCMALTHRKPEVGLLHHTDRGCQYTSHAYHAVLNEHSIRISMSCKVNCWDNAVMERFFGPLRRECTSGTVFPTHKQARTFLFASIEVSYNRLRKHSTLGSLRPMQHHVCTFPKR